MSQVKKESEVFVNCAPVLVYSYPSSPHQTIYKVSPCFSTCLSIPSFLEPVCIQIFSCSKLAFTAQSLARKSNMCSALPTWLSLSRWSTCPYQTVLNSKFPFIIHRSIFILLSRREPLPFSTGKVLFRQYIRL